MPPRKKRPAYETEKDPFPVRLRDAMEKKNISRADLADAVGVSASAVGQYLSGHTRPSYEKLVSISRLLHEPIDYLLGATESRSVDLTDREICNRTNLTDRAREALADLSRSGGEEDYQKDCAVYLINAMIETLCRDPAFLKNFSLYWRMNQEIIYTTGIYQDLDTGEYDLYDPDYGGALVPDPDGDEMTLLRARIEQTLSRLVDDITESTVAYQAASAFTKAHPERFWKDTDGNIAGPIWYTRKRMGRGCDPERMTFSQYRAEIAGIMESWMHMNVDVLTGKEMDA